MFSNEGRELRAGENGIQQLVDGSWSFITQETADAIVRTAARRHLGFLIGYLTVGSSIFLVGDRNRQ